MVKLKRKHDTLILTLQPNRSANWRQNKLLIMLMAAFVMIIAIAWSIAGAWVILPFAGFEVGLLAFLMYRVSYSTYQKQIITINKNQLTFHSGVYYPKRFYSFCIDNVILKIIEPKTEYEQTVMTLQDNNQQLCIGQFLNQQDRLTTLAHLKKANIHIQRDNWWQNQ
jgi:uncharacterized membrane protein